MKRIFITGFLAILPLVVSVYVIGFLYGLIASSMTPIMMKITRLTGFNVPEALAGLLAILFFLIILFVVGLFTQVYVGKALINFLDRTAARIPIVRKVYVATKQVIDSVGSSNNNFQKVVMVRMFGQDKECVGFVIRDTQKIMVDNDEPHYNVFIPTAPSPITGFVIVTPAASCRELSISVEEGIKFILSLGMVNFAEKQPNQ